MQVVIKRIEIDKDDKGRQVVHETRMLDVSGWSAHEVLEDLINDIYQNEDGDGIDYDVSSDSTRELELFGDIVLRYLDKLDEKEPNWKVKELWAEDGINRNGEQFDVNNAIYSVEVF